MAFTLLPISALAAPIDDFNKLSVFLDRLTGNGDYPPITNEYIAPFAYAHGDAIAAATDSSEYSARTVEKEASPDLGGFAIDGKVDWNKVFFHLFRNNDPSPNWDAKFYSSDYYKTGFSGSISWESDKQPNPSYHGEQFNGGLNALVSAVTSALGTNTVWHTEKSAVYYGSTLIIPAVPAVRPVIISVLNGFDNSGKLAEAVISYLQKNNDLTTTSADVAKEVQGNITALKNIFGLFSSDVSDLTSTPVIAFGTGDGAIDITPVAELLLGGNISAIDGNALSDTLKTLSNLLTAIKAKKSTDLEKLIGTPAFLKLVLDLAAAGLDIPDEIVTKLKNTLSGSLSADQWIDLFDELAKLLTEESTPAPDMSDLVDLIDAGDISTGVADSVIAPATQTYAALSANVETDSAAPVRLFKAAPYRAQVIPYDNDESSPSPVSGLNLGAIFKLLGADNTTTVGEVSAGLSELVSLITVFAENDNLSGIVKSITNNTSLTSDGIKDALANVVIEAASTYVPAASAIISTLGGDDGEVNFALFTTAADTAEQIAKIMPDLTLGDAAGLIEVVTGDPSKLDSEQVKALLIRTLGQMGVFSLDTNGNIKDIDVGKALGLLGLNEAQIKAKVADVLEKAIGKLNGIADAIQANKLTLSFLKTEADDIILGIQTNITSELPKGNFRTNVDKLLDKVVPALETAAKDLLLKAHTEDSEWLERNLKAFPTNVVNYIKEYIAKDKSLDNEQKQDLNDLLDAAVGLAEFAVKELDERLHFGADNPDPVGNLEKLLNAYLDYDVATARAGIEEKIPTILNLVKTYAGDEFATKTGISTWIAEQAVDLLKEADIPLLNALSGLNLDFGKIITSDLVEDVLFANDQTQNLSDTMLNLLGNTWVKAANYIKQDILTAANKDSIDKFIEYAYKIQNNAYGILDYIDDWDRVTITVEPKYDEATNAYVTLTTDYDALVYGAAVRSPGYAVFLANLGFKFEYVIIDATNTTTTAADKQTYDNTKGVAINGVNFTIAENKIIANSALTSDTEYSVPVQARIRFDAGDIHYWFTFADATATIKIHDAEAPKITTQPTGATYPQDTAENNVTSLAVDAEVTDGGTLTYQWNVSADSGNTYTDVIDATQRTYTPPTNALGSFLYYVTVTNTVKDIRGENKKSTDSEKVTVIISQATNAMLPVITGHLEGAVYSINATSVTDLSVTANATDGGTLSYQWQSSSDNGATEWTNIGEDKNTYTPPVSTVGETYYRVVITNTKTDATGTPTAKIKSASVNIKVLALVDAQPPSINDPQLSGATIYAGENATLQIYASPQPAAATLSYQWYSSTDYSASSPSSATWTEIDGATSAQYPITTEKTASSSTTYYKVIVKNTDNTVTGNEEGTATSEVVAVTVTALTKVTPAELTGVTSPAAGATPSTAIAGGTGYTAVLIWNDSPATFAYNTPYTATITLTATTGYTFTGVSDISSFTVNGQTPTLAENGNTGSALTFTVAFTATAKQQYTVTVNGGNASATSAVEGTTVTLTATVPEGKKLTGWTTSNSIDIHEHSFTMPAENVTITATYEQITYEVTFGTTGDNSAKGSLTAQVNGLAISTGALAGHGKTVVFTASPNTGYKVNWTIDGSQDSNTSNTHTIIALSAATAVVVEFELIEYEILYTLGDGADNSTDNPAVYTVELLPLTLLAPTRANYSFAGWSLNGGTSKYSEIPTGFSGNINLTATWIATPYSISYIVGDGENASENPSSYDVTDSAITLQAPTRTGYTFDKWTIGDDEITEIVPADYAPNAISLTAHWIAIPYNIAYDLSGGTNASGNPSGYTMDAQEITLQSPTRTGYDFVNWTDAGGSAITKITPAEFTVPADIALTANWTPTSYTIAYNLDSGTNGDDNPTEYTIEDAITLSDPTRAGYTFAGWTGAGVTQDTDDNYVIATGTTGNIELTATWELITYTVTFDANGGNAVSLASALTGVGGKLASLPEPTRSGYSFTGWFTAESGGTQITTSTVFDTDSTIYAQWRSNGNSFIDLGPSGGGTSSSSSSSSSSTTTAPSDDRVIEDEQTALSEFVEAAFPFIDVLKATDWFYDDVYYVFQKGLMTGTTDTSFAPGMTITRGMLVTILGRHFGIDTSKFSAPRFSDVDASQYYAPYVAWASEKGIVNGIGGGKFDPDAPITRQDAAALLLRYANFIGLDSSATAAIAFADASEIGSYATDGVGWAVKLGLVNGKPGNIFDPRGDMSRGETAAILHRFLLVLDDLDATDDTDE
jgi:uncharacterized repeat protein (TIGR02543 family)